MPKQENIDQRTAAWNFVLQGISSTTFNSWLKSQDIDPLVIPETPTSSDLENINRVLSQVRESVDITPALEEFLQRGKTTPDDPEHHLRPLAERDERILRFRYRLNPEGAFKSLAALAKEEGVTPERIRQLEARARRRVLYPISRGTNPIRQIIDWEFHKAMGKD